MKLAALNGVGSIRRLGRLHLRHKAHQLETGAAALALLTMAALPIAEAALRTFYPSGIPGAANWVLYLALWAAFLGAMIAARRGELLSLDAAEHLVAEHHRGMVRTFTAGVTVAVCAVLAQASYSIVAVEYQVGDVLSLGVPVWLTATIMPVGFAVIGIRAIHRLPSVRQRLIALAFVLVPIGLGFIDDPTTSHAAMPLVGALIVALALGAPIFVGLAGIALVLLWHDLWGTADVALQVYHLSLEPFLPTIPLFTLAGYILAESDAPQRLVKLFRAAFGWMPGGIAVVAVVVCAFFTSFTGGSGVTILAMGGLMFPMLLRDHQPERFASGLLTSAGSLGLLFPPSLAVILYAVVARVDIPRLFVAGWLPAVVEIVLVSAFVILYSARHEIPRTPFDARTTLSALWQAKWEVAIPLVVLGSIATGFATLVEASAITVLYTFAVAFFVHRDLSIRSDLLRVVAAAATLIGGVLLILGVARGLTEFLIVADVPGVALTWIQRFVESPLVFLLLLNGFLLLVGCLMDIYSAIVVVVPLIAPIGAHFGVDPLHLGIIFLVNLELGYLTPPVGMNLFLASYRFQRPLSEIYRATLPFLAIRTVAVLLVTYVPVLTTWLPAVLFD
ncbi:MAG: TRAP transporter large permease subunit [Acidobacteriota bacterium]